jgi:hypothetical protein
MTVRRRFVAAAAAAFVCLSAHAADWIARSNENAQPLLEALAEFSPEFASRYGVTGYDDKVMSLPVDREERIRKVLDAARAQLETRLAAEQDPHVREDLRIMIDAARRESESSALTERLTVPYADVGQIVFRGEFNLLQDDVDAKRRPSALTRLKCYTGLAHGCTPLTEQARALYEAMARDDRRIKPFRGEIEQGLAKTKSYTSGIRDLYRKYGITGAETALAALEKQLADYDAWTRATVLPTTRTDFRLPPALYADNLRDVGIDITPDELIARAELAYAEIRGEMRALAPLVARQSGLTASDYRDVIRELKKNQIPRDRIEPTYREVIGKIEDIIRRQNIVTLPERPMQMRLASEAENAASPAPHMIPPPMIGNKGERGTFVLTLGNPTQGGNADDLYDDFNHPGMTWTLTAHEGRPGHELQFSAMVERGVSLARSLFAFNSVNVEGWALYAEAEMRPYEPLDAQLFTLQARLQRAARAFLDPMLNLGRIDPVRAKAILTDGVMLSPAMAQQEIDRYTFRAPGQATAYFYGYSRLMQLRSEAEIALGPKFDRKAFNDFVIGQGLLPPDLLAAAVRDEFIPAHRTDTPR